MRKTMELSPEVAFALSSACRKEPAPVSALLVTMKTDGVVRSSSSTTSKAGLVRLRARRSADRGTRICATDFCHSENIGSLLKKEGGHGEEWGVPLKG